jgi:hypothetical protein
MQHQVSTWAISLFIISFISRLFPGKKKKDDDSGDEDGSLSDATTMDDNASVVSDVVSVADHSDEEIEILDSILKQTRSGRQPKKVEDMMYLPPKELASRLRCRSASISSETGSEIIGHEVTPGRPGSHTPTRVFQVPSNIVNFNEINQLTPGKVMILTNRELVGSGPEAKEVIHVFMVTPNQSPHPGGVLPHPPGMVPHQPGASPHPGAVSPHPGAVSPHVSGIQGMHRMPGPNLRLSTGVPACPMEFNQLPESVQTFRMPQSVRTSHGFRGNIPTQTNRLPHLNQNIPATVSAPPVTDILPMAPQPNSMEQTIHSVPGVRAPLSMSTHKTSTNTAGVSPYQNYTINQGKVMQGHSGGVQGHSSPSTTTQSDVTSEPNIVSKSPIEQQIYSLKDGKLVQGETFENKFPTSGVTAGGVTSGVSEAPTPNLQQTFCLKEGKLVTEETVVPPGVTAGGASSGVSEAPTPTLQQTFCLKEGKLVTEETVVPPGVTAGGVTSDVSEAPPPTL